MLKQVEGRPFEDEDFLLKYHREQSKPDRYLWQL